MDETDEKRETAPAAAPRTKDPPAAAAPLEKQVTFAASQVERLSKLEPIPEGDDPSKGRPPAAVELNVWGLLESDDENAGN